MKNFKKFSIFLFTIELSLLQCLHISPASATIASNDRTIRQQLEFDERENRKQIWSWLDQFQANPQKEAQFMEDILRRSQEQQNSEDSSSLNPGDSVEVDYFDADLSPSKPSSKPKRSSSSSQITDALRFSSTRTNSDSVSLQQSTTRKPPTSSVLHLPPVKPEWTFDCPTNESGYFADFDNDCRVYYRCVHERRERQRFQCPIGTRFNQDSSNCDWWDKVKCVKPIL